MNLHCFWTKEQTETENIAKLTQNIVNLPYCDDILNFSLHPLTSLHAAATAQSCVSDTESFFVIKRVTIVAL